MVDRPGLGELLVTGARTSAACSSPIAARGARLPRRACAVARSAGAARRARSPPSSCSRSCRSRFVYEVAHYFSLFVIQGQFAVPLLSDPFGPGLGPPRHGRRACRTSPSLTPNTIWYVQAGALVVGHVAALAVAHDRAVDVFARPRRRAAVAVRDARADGPLHGRWPLAPVARMSAARARRHPGADRRDRRVDRRRRGRLRARLVARERAGRRRASRPPDARDARLTAATTKPA